MTTATSHDAEPPPDHGQGEAARWCMYCHTEASADPTVHWMPVDDEHVREHFPVCQYCRLLRGLLAWRAAQNRRKGEYRMAYDEALWNWGDSPAVSLAYLLPA